jgi:ABC-2 type transport system permease protein
MTMIRQSIYMLQRHLRNLLRQPFWVVFTLVQPIIWLLLYGQLFKRVVELPGFNANSYISFLTPGIIISTALFAGGWNGMGIIADLNRGVIDRLLLSPVSRAAIIIGRILSLCVAATVQSIILIVLGLILGARFAGGVVGILILFVSSMLLAAAFGALSNGLALVARKEESVIGASNMLLLPLTFISPIYMAKALMPQWMQMVSRFNPVSWSVEAGRAAMSGNWDWRGIGIRMAALLLFAVLSGWVATQAFRSYQKSI